MSVKSLAKIFVVLSLISSFAAHAAKKDEGEVSAQTEATVSPVSELTKAYQREFAFLKAQKRQLLKQKEGLKADYENKINKAEKELTALQGQLVAVSGETEHLSELYTEIQRTSESLEETNALLERTVSQASVSLAPYGVEVPESASEVDSEAAAKSEAKTLSLQEQQIKEIFVGAVKALGTLGDVRVEPGEFFLTNGKKVQGDIVKVGAIASYGLSSEGGGPLAPAGEGRLKLWSEGHKEAATLLAQGQMPQTLPVFLYENLNQPVEQQEGKSAFEVVQSGGMIAWVIVVMGLVAFLMIGVRAYLLKRAQDRQGEGLEELVSSIKNGQWDKAQTLCRGRQGVSWRVMAHLVGAFSKGVKDKEHIDDMLSENLLRESVTLDRFGTMILVFASVAPLMGLLGTVTGMISTFDIITEFGTGDPKLLSGGISEALVTTELGLIVAIPVLLAGSLLGAWSKRIKEDVEASALKVSNVYFEKIDETEVNG